MTKTNKTSVRTIVACALAATLTAGITCAPAIAATPVTATDPCVCAQSLASSGYMSEGDAVYIARCHLGIAAEDVRDLDVDLEWYAGTTCWEVEIETFGSDAEYHMMVEASDGTILGSWVEW